MLGLLLAGGVVLLFSALLTISGVGAAFILIPVFVAFGELVHQAMASALLLNALAMALASALYIRKGLVDFRVAVPMLIAGSVSAPVCARLSNAIDRTPLLWMFAAFCALAGILMLFFSPRIREAERSRGAWIRIGLAMGFLAGIGGGLLGVGGGNLLVAVLVVLGLGPKQAAATTAFIVIFLCLAGFAGHAATGLVEPGLMLTAAAGAVAGALLGAWLLVEKLAAGQVKRIVGGVLLLIAGKVVLDLLA